MKNVLLFGAGRVAGPFVKCLLGRGHRLTVASEFVEQAEQLVAGHPAGNAIELVVREGPDLVRLVSEHDLAVSLLPPALHPLIARACVTARRPLVTTSYVSPEMRELDSPARAAGVLLLNEIGLDPGIDHMTAMRVIHEVQARGGVIRSFRSYCGGLPAPRSNDNPWGYKFSWSPRGVFQAATRAARWLEDGKLIEVPGERLFDNPASLTVQGIELEAFPNRDSTGYKEAYGLQGASTVFRGTLRYPGWSRTLRAIRCTGLLDDVTRHRLDGMTYAAFLRSLVPGTGNLRDDVARAAGELPQAPPLHWMEWLGLFSNDLITLREETPLGVLADLAGRRLVYQRGESDMIVMRHDFLAEWRDHRESITSTLVDFGEDGGESAMARTVGLPCAIASHLILERRIKATGVMIPVDRVLYEPILEELARFALRMREERQRLPAG
ncbi:MAG: saccharopine dehydrogenase C-terminal domain-containing protein [Planctomycetota bacterium]